MKLSKRDPKEFTTYFRGLPNNILQTACTNIVSGIDYRGCSKPALAECWASREHGIGQVETATIARQVRAMLDVGRVSRAQHIRVEVWLKRAGYD